MSKDDLLWINKDASNLESREHFSAVNSHVQRISRSRPVRNERAEQLDLRIPRLSSLRQRQEESDGASDDVSSTGFGQDDWTEIHDGPPATLPGRFKNTQIDSSSSSSSLVPYGKAPALGEGARDQHKRVFMPQKRQVAMLHSIIPADPSTSSLDPFFRLPDNFSNKEKNLIHTYVTTMPRVIYGTHMQAKYCPVRDTNTGISENALFTQWIMLGAELYVAQIAGAVDRAHIFHRKASIYGALSRLIAKPESRYSKTTMEVLAAAPIAEARFGDVELGRKHCVGLLHLLNSYGGPPALLKMTSTASIATRFLVSFVTVGAGHELFADHNKLASSLRSLKDTLLAIQTWNRSFFLTDPIVRGSRTFENSLREELVPSSTSYQLSKRIQRYYQTRAEAFAPTSPLHRFIMPSFDEHNLIDQRCHIVILTILAKVLFDMRNDHVESVRFLDEIVSTVASGQITGEIDPPQMKAVAILYMVIDCAARYELIGVQSPSGVLRSWDAIEVLELIQMGSDRGRRRVTELLSSSLTGAGGGPYNPFLTVRELTAICDEIRLAWMRENKTTEDDQQGREKLAADGRIREQPSLSV